ncbi:16S rRNA processing protein RimM [Veillonellaceae bacterium WCA-693-APC-5D-A]|uniref:Ribosome maturation factor RimM n=1 Tax=Anaerovibrio slackiae TaxID=2652309 RepID=A0A6I2UEI6_9FIRM|nr:ribosome maturation factor RimM [Anaerovibrio slackiae]MBQ2010970.1 16S rRNA processing protein RimM [Selenomonadaceae bacterium]MBQ2409980.1 16S rRNA processing protein RimM [Selenomonadaceae bacterium]MBQ5586093.1 16S rRNA processing protein RimM [Selenomonadaceae bacterium]MBQ5733596.1 16S rRNA processing protein RimM [Selenomonadaceae bacterium]MBQ5919879.1 16S rRNA processing protein RimM [Selenomonadaceae bacterium]
MIRSSQSAAKKNRAADKGDRIVIGKAGAPHGVRGEMRVIPLTDFPERFQELEHVYVGDELMDVEDCWYHKQFVIMKLKQCPHREAAALLTGKLLYVDKSEAMPLEEGEYYTFDIIGLEVFDLEGESLGFVTEVLKTGSNDVYVVSRKGQAKQILVPALKAVVKEINVPEGRMVVDLPEEA